MIIYSLIITSGIIYTLYQIFKQIRSKVDGWMDE
jgi:hypothetical protein